MDFTIQQAIRGMRDQLLRDSDFSQLADSPLDSTAKANWATYRQELRDLPVDQDIDSMEAMSEVTWPAKPS